MYFHYDLEDAGWATARLGPKGDIAVMTVSYLNDSLKELAAAAISISQGAADAKVLFEDEPGEHWLHLKRLDEQTLEYEIVFKEDEGDKVGIRKCVEQLSIKAFDKAILSELKRIFLEYGEAGYLQKWGEHVFPRAEMRKLEELSN